MRNRQASDSFLKKRTKKLLFLRSHQRTRPWQSWLAASAASGIKVFWFFFSKKNRLLLSTEAVASVELGLISPVFLLLCMATGDFSMIYHKQMQLSSALTAGGEYAFTQGQNESGATLTQDVSNFVQAISPITLSNVTVSYNGGLNASSFYCVSGSPAVYSGPYSAGAACNDGSGSTAGKFVSVSGTYAYKAMFGADQKFFASQFAQALIVRLQ